ncbi:MAG: hypothetical protein JRH15_05030 [Deltaproteobacteria bacterium]|nr:hypothetical protein [Deltaproteobacteria bacterium]
MPQQVSVFAENKPGKIHRITKVLEREVINIRALTIADTGDYGIIKLLLDKPAEGCRALKEEGFAATLKEIVAVRIEDKPGGLRKASEVLAQGGINVEDAYGFTICETGQALFVFQVENVKHTEKILKEAGFPIIGDRELYFLS